MKKINVVLILLFLNGCSFSAIEMTAEPTIQKYDLSDPEGDGVISARDACPESFSGADINNDGCGVESLKTIKRELMVNFKSGSAKVESKYYPEIQSLADFLKENPLVEASIEGHTSVLGNANSNKKLSLQRADAIKALLINKYGIKNTRIKSIGYGEEQLLFKGSSQYVHAKNRRIVVEIIGETKSKELKWTIYSVDKN